MNSRKFILLIPILFLCSCSSSANMLVEKGTLKTDTVKFIIIANVGSSNYSIAPIIISTDTIKSIPYQKGIYDLHIRFSNYLNIIISKEKYDTLFSYLNFYQKCEERPNKFIQDDKSIFIIDYRDNLDKDCKLLTLKSVSTTLFTLNSLYCYLESKDFDVKILNHLKNLYKFYIDTYDYKKEHFKIELDCDIN